MTEEIKKIHPLIRLIRYAKSHQKEIALASLFSVLNKIFDLAPPALIGAAVDIVVQQENSFLARMGFEDVLTQLWVLGLVTLLIWGLESLFEYLFQVRWRNLAQTIEHDMRKDAYSHVQNLEMAYFEDQSTGGLMSILNDDINQLERFLDSGANTIIQLVTTILVIGGMFFYLAPTVAWMSILPMPFILWGSIHFQRLLTPRYADVREKVGMLNSQLANNLGGIATIKSYTAESHESARIAGESEGYRQSNRRAITLSSAFVPLIRMLIVIGFTAMLISGGMLTVKGGLAVGVYTVLVFMTQRLLWPLTSLGNTLDMYQRAMASTRRVFGLLDTEPGIISGAQSLAPGTVDGLVSFEQVDFSYSDGLPVLKNLSIQINPGETAAIVGSTGSGKSTIVKLLLRLYDVTGGVIRVDGHDLRRLETADLRKSVALVSQDVFLFHGSVLENITYGTFGASMDEVVAAAKMAEAHEFIVELANGYDTIVGERGQKLSGGQRQRISIARAILKDAPILILDEATSSVDNETEAAIQRSLEKIVVGRTTIVIAHRLSTIRNADKIFVIERGNLIEQGKHEELVALDGVYASLWRVQTGERVR